ncbi:hypothetical protein, partial [Mycobacterium marinum]|uniref:hypothetical protein n=1 Tax=Mycobacterium marinum TaxID=1781 RepID=UPI003565402F
MRNPVEACSSASADAGEGALGEAVDGLVEADSDFGRKLSQMPWAAKTIRATRAAAPSSIHGLRRRAAKECGPGPDGDVSLVCFGGCGGVGGTGG